MTKFHFNGQAFCNRSCTGLLLLLLLLLPGFTYSDGGQQRLKPGLRLDPDGKYRGLRVGIPHSWPAESQLVDKVIELLRSFSKQLKFATAQIFAGRNATGLSIGSVTIILPWNWRNAAQSLPWPVRPATPGEFYETAEIRLVDSPSAAVEVEHSGVCGVQGERISIGVKHVLSSIVYWLGKQLVSAFAQFRYGLFPESNRDSSVGPLFYFKDGKLLPAICNSRVTGVFRHRDSYRPCRLNLTSLEPAAEGDECEFHADGRQELAIASLMAVTSVKSLSKFCESGVSSATGHNREAPVPQNRFCRRRSAEEVMLNSRCGDFRHPPNGAGDDGGIEEPVIELAIEQARPGLAVILDPNGSPEALKAMKSAVAVAAAVLEPEASINLLVVDSDPQSVFPAAQFGTPEAREAFKETMPQFQSSPSRRPDDGADGEAVAVASVDAAIQLTNTLTNIGHICLLNSPKNLRYLSSVTTTASAIPTVSIEFQPFEKIDLHRLLTELSGIHSVSQQNVVLASIESSKAAVKLSSFYVDQTASHDLTLIHSWPVNNGDSDSQSPHELRLVAPSGAFLAWERGTQSREAPVAQVLRSDLMGVEIIRLKGANEVGRYTVSHAAGSKLTVMAKSAMHSSTGSVMLLDYSFLNYGEDTDCIIDSNGAMVIELRRVDSTVKLAIRAQLHLDGKPVIGARLQAKLSPMFANGTHASEILLPIPDNGVEPDNVAGDGRHVTSVPLWDLLKQELGMRPDTDSRLIRWHFRVEISSLWPVERVAPTGELRVVLDPDAHGGVEGVQARLSRVPPSAVLDLSNQLDLQGGSLRLNWTAGGDRLGLGTAAAVEILASQSFSSLLEDFESTFPLNSMITVARVKPEAPGTEQSITLSRSQLPQNGTFCLGLRVKNNQGIYSEMSNIVSAQFQRPSNVDVYGNIDGNGSLDSSSTLPTDGGSELTTAQATADDVTSHVSIETTEIEATIERTDPPTEISTGSTASKPTEISTGSTASKPTEISTGSTESKPTENSTGATEQKTTENSTAATDPRSTENSTAATDPRSTENSTAATDPRSTENSTAATDPRSTENSTAATDPRSTENSTAATDPRSTENSTAATDPRSTEISTGATDPRSTEISTDMTDGSTEASTDSDPTLLAVIGGLVLGLMTLTAAVLLTMVALSRRRRRRLNLVA